MQGVGLKTIIAMALWFIIGWSLAYGIMMEKFGRNSGTNAIVSSSVTGLSETIRKEDDDEYIEYWGMSAWYGIPNYPDLMAEMENTYDNKIVNHLSVDSYGHKGGKIAVSFSTHISERNNTQALDFTWENRETGESYYYIDKNIDGRLDAYQNSNTNKLLYKNIWCKVINGNSLLKDSFEIVFDTEPIIIIFKDGEWIQDK
jgi:hypothetical protein